MIKISIASQGKNLGAAGRWERQGEGSGRHNGAAESWSRSSGEWKQHRLNPVLKFSVFPCTYTGTLSLRFIIVQNL